MDKTETGAKRLAKIALFVALLAVCAQIYVPLSGGVGVTLQTLAVMLCSCILGSDGVFAVAVYLFCGAIGLPVFSAFGSTSALFSPTGGFLIGFLPMSLSISLVCRTGGKRKKSRGCVDTKNASDAALNSLRCCRVFGNACVRETALIAISCTVDTILCYVCGAAWFAGFYALHGAEKTFSFVLSACILPFLPVDACKIALCAVLSPALRRFSSQKR